MSANRIRFRDGSLDDVASILAAAHPRAAEYLAQAPVLAVVACRKFEGIITYGEVDTFAASVDAEPRLRDLMSRFQVPLQFRTLVADALRPNDGPALAALSRLNPSKLAQSIPIDSQRVWLDGVRSWLRLAPRKKSPHFTVAWIAQRLGEDLSRFEQVDALIDFLARSGSVLNDRWSWKRAMEEVTAWHTRLRDENMLRRLASIQREAVSFDKVICNSGLPDVAEQDGFSFHVLRTLRHLRDEGSTLHHCVASYASEVRHGRCTIVSVRRDGVNVATLQINDRGTVAQLKGYCNAAPSPSTRAACDLYALRHWRKPETEDK